MNCPHCHQAISEQAIVCDSCGTSISAPRVPAGPGVAEASSQSETSQQTDPLIGQLLDGKYELTALLGQGGMGTVYRARRVHIGDEVAVKVLRREYVNDEKTVERFRREARAAATLRHPNIVIIHDFSEGRGDVPAYIVMELVEGNSLRKILETDGALAQGRAIWLIREICKGVGAAHRLHAVHRDIKPDNIIVLTGDAEDRERVKVVDFGIAKLREAAASKTLTQTGKVIGTLYYMSPEQCYGEAVDPRSDVYSLGIMLYEMLCGTPPFTSESATGIVAKHLTETPPPLPKHLGIVPQVEAVIMRALAKEPASRPVDARKLGRELAIGIGVSEERDESAYSRQTIDSIRSADTELAGSARATQAHESAQLSGPASSQSNRWPWLGVGGVVALLIIAAAIAVVKKLGPFSRRVAPAEQSSGGAALGPWQLKQTLAHNNKVYALAFSPDDRLLATASSESVNDNKDFVSEVKLWDAQTGALKQTLPEESGGVLSVAFSPDGRLIATATGSASGEKKLGNVEVWDAHTGALKWSRVGHTAYATSVAFSPDGRLVASGGWDHEVKFWDASDGALKRTLRGDGKVYAVAFSPDGRTLASTNQQTVQLWDVETGQSRQSLAGHTYPVDAVVFSLDGQMVASANMGGNIRIWSTQTSALKQTLKGQNDFVVSLSFSPDGKLLASGSYDSTVVLWNTQTGVQEKTLNHADKVTAVAFSHDGRTLATGSFDKTVRLWQ
jgi:eukaryotic-like serine/threonine-protein kinase